MPFAKLLVANRGEIAIRIMQAAADCGIATVAVHSDDDAGSLHLRKADEVRPVQGRGAAAYLDIDAIVEAARAAGCDAVHPGYGFLAENADFARACGDAGLTFVGPDPESLELFGDKARARGIAAEIGVPLLPGSDGAVGLEEARRFLARQCGDGAMVIKAVAGGGGRGMRPVRKAEELERAFEVCRAEAQAAFGDGSLYVERFVPRARHVEVQIAGDAEGALCHLWERECTLQRRYQKLIEVAPSPTLTPALRERLLAAALQMAEAAQYQNIGTFEFLIDDATLGDDEPAFYFIEANARLQVEHTVTEQVTGVDLVRLQLGLAAGRSLTALGLDPADPPQPRGFALQARVNMESVGADGSTRPAGGTLTAYEAPAGPGIRVDGCGYAGYASNPSFDSLLAKVIGHAPAGGYADAVARTYRALCEFRVEGVVTNLPLLRNLLRHPDVVANRIDTRFLEDNAAELAGAGEHRRMHAEAKPDGAPRRAGATVDAGDPLAVLEFGRAGRDAAFAEAAGDDANVVRAPMQGTIVSISVKDGDAVGPLQPLLVMDAMKMQHDIAAGIGGTVLRVLVTAGDTVYEGHPLVEFEPGEVAQADAAAAEEIDLDAIRPDLQELLDRLALTRDAARPQAVARRRKTGQRTARENVEDLCDPGTFIEYGSLVLAARRRRMELEELRRATPADGLITGIGTVNGDRFGEEAARTAILSYDYTVLAGTQGKKNHIKKDRMFELAAEWRMPLVFFTEGGGGRPGDTDHEGVAGLVTMAFHLYGRLSGLVPLVGINSGRCFAGNAALLGCSDVVIATRNSSIGMGGPAMIEGGGLGVFTPEEVGPTSVQVPNGVIDVLVEDEAEGVRVAKQYLSYFQGKLKDWQAPDQRLLRRAVPENRLRVYDVRSVVETLADTGSVLELRRHFGLGMVTALIRIEGRPVGIVANNPTHLAGAIDSDGADKATRFMQLCDAFDVPLVFLCDTPGMMVGPEVEKTALVRHCSRMFVTGANLSVPFATVVLRKAYGLGAQAMAGGSFHAPMFAVAWPTGEFGGMGLEGAVKLGFRNELAAVEDAAARKALYERMVAEAYERGKAISTASFFEVDEVIDPADTRRWILSAFRAARAKPRPAHKKRPNIDAW